MKKERKVEKETFLKVKLIPESGLGGLIAPNTKLEELEELVIVEYAGLRFYAKKEDIRHGN